MSTPSSAHSPPWGGSHSHANLSISHATGGFAAHLGIPNEGDDPNSATLEMLPGSNPTRIQDHVIPMYHTHTSPSFAATSSFGLDSYVDDSGHQTCIIEPRRSIPFLSENSSSGAKPWTALGATGVPDSSSIQATGPLPDHNAYLSPRKSIDCRSRSFKDSALGTEERSQYDTQSQMSRPLAEMNPPIPGYYQGSASSQPEEVMMYADEEDYQDPPQIDVAQETPTSTRRGARQSIKNREELKCEQCGKSVKTPSDLKKHIAGHDLQFLCNFPQCPRQTKGFATINDLNRHRKSVHKAPTPGSRSFKCFADGCSKSDKIWPRLDNFKQHLKRLHPNDNTDELLRRSNEWYDQENPEDPTQSHAVRNELRSQERNVAEENKRKRVKTQHQSDDTNKRRRLNTGGFPSSPLALPMSFSLSTTAQQRSKGPGRSPAASAQNDPQHRTTLFRRLGPNRVAPSSMSAPIQGMPRPRSASVQQVPNHVNLPNDPQNAFIPAGIDPQLFEWTQNEQPQIPQVPPQVPSMLEQSYYTSQQFMYNPIQSMRIPRTIADPGDLADLRQQQINYMLGPDQLPQLSAECDLTEGGILAEVGAGNGTILDTGPVMGHLHTTPTIRVSDHELDSRVTPVSDLSHRLRAILEDYEAKRNGIGQYTSDEELQQLRKKFLEILGNDSTIPTGSETSLSQSSSGESRYPVKDRKCPYCGKVKKLPSDLKKHLKRHERPYGCVLDECFKSFGSKNDWKRHEGTHRTQVQCFRCDGRHSCPDSGIPCKKVFYKDKDEYCQHLLKCGVPRSNVNDIAERRLIRSNNQRGFWCGFCDDIIRHDYESLDALNVRINHIDNHFHKDGRRIDDWIELGGEGKKKSEVQQKSKSETKLEQDIEERPDAAMHQDEHHESHDSTNSMSSVSFSSSNSGSYASSVSSPPPTSQSQKQNYSGGGVQKASQQTTQHMSHGLQRQLSSSSPSPSSSCPMQHIWQQGGMMTQQPQKQQQQQQEREQQQDSSQAPKAKGKTIVICCNCETMILPELTRRCVHCNHTWCKFCGVEEGTEMRDDNC